MIMKLYIGYFYQKTITVNSWSIDTQNVILEHIKSIITRKV